MRSLLSGSSLLFAAGAWLAVAALVSPAFADECQCKTKSAGKAPACPAEAGNSLLSKLPMLQRLFQDAADADEQDGCPADVERIGVDFDFGFALGDCPLGLKVANCGQCEAAEGKVICVVACNQACDQGCSAKCAKGEGECPALDGKTKACQGKTCSATACQKGECGVATCNAQCATKCATKCDAKCEGTDCKVAACEKAECCPALCAAKCIAKCAAVACCDQAGCDQACCDVACCPQTESAMAKGPNTWELWDHIAALASENAALQVRLESQEDREELLDQLVGLTAENAKLEAKVELAEAKLAMMQQMVELAVENKQLKAHAEALARQLQSHEAPARTSQRTPVLTPAR